jgi:hypothetical protein
VSGPIENQTTNKANKTKNTQNNNKTKTTKHREVGSLLALRHKMHDVILYVIVSMATEKEAKQRQQRTKQKGAMQEGERSNKAQCGNRGSPQPGSQRSQRAAIQA